VPTLTTVLPFAHERVVFDRCDSRLRGFVTTLKWWCSPRFVDRKTTPSATAHVEVACADQQHARVRPSVIGFATAGTKEDGYYDDEATSVPLR
jgi:hypothetical protein